ncbi:hypothetical protein [Cytobacillus firmus]|uniref:hypothetical protein n=1 Tax=Cytobacillus firmus TaxID=1399 RepID=UPI003002EE51
MTKENDKSKEHEIKGNQNNEQLDTYYNFNDDYEFYYYQPWRLGFPFNTMLGRRFYYYDKKKDCK